MKSILLAIASMAVIFVPASGADLSGNWVATLSDQGDALVRQIGVALVQHGSALTGHMTGDGTPISEGKISGDSFTFAVVGPKGKAIFKGRLVKGELHAVQSRDGDDQHTRTLVFNRQPGKTQR